MMLKKIIKDMTSRGYVFKKDVFGYYFDRGSFRLSIVKNGPVFNCFKNQLVNRKFVVIDRKIGVPNLEFCHQWLLQHGV